MTVHCPNCLTGYELPRSLMGKHGARVRCPGCQEVFVVLPEGEPVREAPAPHETLPEAMPHEESGSTATTGATGRAREEAAASSPPQAAAVYQPAVVAGAVLDVMVDFLGAALTRSRERGTVLSDHGPAIVAVWEEYRRRAGDDAPAAEFRVALKDRIGIDLTPRSGA